MKLIRTEDAVGQVLCHDVTQIIRGVTKGARFRKGHIVTEEDIPVLKSLGKDNLYVWEKDDTVYHENEAAGILCQVCMNEHMAPSEVREGKIELTAECDGLFRIDVERLDEINDIDQVMIASRHTNTPVKKGDKLLGTRVIPLVIAKEKMELVRERAGGAPLCELLPYRLKTAGIVTTGNEVFYGRIQDTFTPVSYTHLVLPAVFSCSRPCSCRRLCTAAWAVLQGIIFLPGTSSGAVKELPVPARLWSVFRLSGDSVSYTHLDVYKRQAVIRSQV